MFIPVLKQYKKEKPKPQTSAIFNHSVTNKKNGEKKNHEKYSIVYYIYPILTLVIKMSVMAGRSKSWNQAWQKKYR